MAWQIVEQTVTIPAGTAIDSPGVYDIPLGVYEVERIRWRVPPGPNGTMGWALGMAGQPIIPTEVGKYIVADDEADDWYLDNLLNSGAWQVFGYNTGAYDHSVLFQFFVTPIAAPTTVAVPSLASSSSLES